MEDNQKDVPLIWATSLIDKSFDWQGRRLIEEQTLQFPRYGIVDYDGYYFEPQTTPFPKKLKDATCEMALTLLSNNPVSDSPLDSGITEIKVDTIMLKFDKDGFTGDSKFDGNGIPMKVVSLLKEFIYTSTNVQDGIVRVARS